MSNLIFVRQDHSRKIHSQCNAMSCHVMHMYICMHACMHIYAIIMEIETETETETETEEAEVKLVNQSCSKELGGCILLPHPLQVV